jgi:hypothetical protein
MERLNVGINGGENMEKGQLYCCELDSKVPMLEWIDRAVQSSDDHVVFFSRLPHRRLIDQLDITKVETYWLTDRVGQGHIAPDLAQVHSLILARVNNHRGLIILEGLEWLVTLHGETTVLNFIRGLRDDLHRTQWSLLLPINPLAFNSIWVARLHREAPLLELSGPKTESLESESVVEESTVEPIFEERGSTEEGLPHLVMLTRLPETGFTKQILRKRILQWRRMGLDVSEVEPALHFEDSEAHALYSKVEEKVRRAVELERRIDTMKSDLSASELTTSKFRIRQLTGLDELESLMFTN